jgi:tRNA dimethylallyltransferase
MTSIEFQMPTEPGALVIAGPTASGKSDVALRLAEALDGVVINADSMQLYRELRILTARPGERDEAKVPHRLYGICAISEPCSVGRWLDLARREIFRARRDGRVPIVVGGTGLYLSALTDGLSQLPDIPPDIRSEVRARLRDQGPEALYRDLSLRDPAMAEQLKSGDSQRIARALEVLEASGRSLDQWRREAPCVPGLEGIWHGFVLERPRDLLYERCNARFDAMIEEGGLAEVAGIMHLRGHDDYPALKALGLPELMAHVAGECSLECAVSAAKQATRRYAKRQMTWFRNKMMSWNVVSEQQSESFYDKIMSKISQT